MQDKEVWSIEWLPKEMIISTFDMPFSLSLIISGFWFKVRDMQPFLSLEHFTGIIGLLTGPISKLLCLSE